mgnify:CR=1 FL=1
MEKRSFKKLKKFCLQFLIIFAIVFASTIILLSTISQFVYEDMRFVRELIISLIGSLVTSMVLYFILKINKKEGLFQPSFVSIFPNFFNTHI